MQFNFVVVNLVVWHLRFGRRNNRLGYRGCSISGAGVKVSNLRNSLMNDDVYLTSYCLKRWIFTLNVDQMSQRPFSHLHSDSCSNHVQFYVTGWWYWCCFVPLLEESGTLLDSLNSHHPLHWDADGVGFIFSNKLPCPKNIQKTLGKQEPVVHCIFEGLKMNHFPEVSSERLFRWYRQLQVLQGWGYYHEQWYWRVCTATECNGGMSTSTSTSTRHRTLWYGMLYSAVHCDTLLHCTIPKVYIVCPLPEQNVSGCFSVPTAVPFQDCVDLCQQVRTSDQVVIFAG